MLTVTTHSDTYDLTILATAKLELGSSDEDDLVANYIRQASDFISRYCTRVFASETVSETLRLDHTNIQYLVLERFPVQSISTITENDVTLEADTDYEVDFTCGIVNRLYADRRALWLPSVRITINYSAGFDLLEDIPYDLERACLLLVRHYYNQNATDPRVRSEAVEGMGTMAFFTPLSIPEEVKELLAGYRNMRTR